MMKDIQTILVLIGTILMSTLMIGQQMDIPRPSPKATVTQMIGVNNITVTYGRPAVRERRIFGNLIPYNKVWRAGANEATTITFKRAVKFEGKDVPKGTYGLFMIPTKDKWTIILNKTANQWGAYNYERKEDLLRVEVIPLKVDFVEDCTFLFEELSKSDAILTLKWENTSIPMRISTDTEHQTLVEIDEKIMEIGNNWYNYSAAAQYHYYELKELKKALEYIDIAIALKAPNPSPWMLKSQILAEQEKYSEAIEYAKKSIIVCKANNFEFEIHENEEQIEKWKILIESNKN